MQLKLSRRVSRDTEAMPDDVRMLKKALNRLGYYLPDKKFGITKIADAEMIEALKRFQTNHGLKSDGIALPDSETLQKLNAALAEKSRARLQWHCVKDGSSCAACIAFDGRIVSTEEADTPGCPGTCRCWVGSIKEKMVSIYDHLLKLYTLNCYYCLG